MLSITVPRALLSRLLVVMLVSLLSLSGCATIRGEDAPDVRVVCLEPLASEGLELRLALKLRVQNPNDVPIDYDGIAVKLDLGGRGLASGVSDARGSVPRFSEQILTVPVSISAFSAIRQVLGVLERLDKEETGKRVLRYSLSGKLGRPTGLTGALRFADEGELDLTTAEEP